MSKEVKLDNLDRQILRSLSKSARTPFKDVAEECGVSRAAIHQRVQKLIDEDVIEGSMFIINPKSVGYLTCTYIGIQLEKGSMARKVGTKLQEIPEIVECHFTTGPYAMMVKLYAQDNAHLMDLLHNKICQIDGIVTTETLISLEECFMREFPIDEEPKPAKRKKTHKNVILLDEES